MNKSEHMVIVFGGGLNMYQAIADALMDGWKCLEVRGVDDDGLMGYVPTNAKYLELIR